MKKRQIGIRLTDAQITLFEALAEKEGCESIAEMFRKAAFSRWPMNKSANCAPTAANCVPTQKENKEEREIFPPHPLKEKEETKEGCCYGARETSGQDGISLAEAIRAAESIPSLSVDLRKPPTLAEAIAYARLRMKHIPPEFIMRYYAEREDKRMFITTNLTPKELIGRYQQRVMTRIREMAIPITFTGKNKRGTTVQELF